MAANIGLLQTITDMLTKTLKKISKIERNIYKMVCKSINDCKSGDMINIPLVSTPAVKY